MQVRGCLFVVNQHTRSRVPFAHSTHSSFVLDVLASQMRHSGGHSQRHACASARTNIFLVVPGAGACLCVVVFQTRARMFPLHTGRIPHSYLMFWLRRCVIEVVIHHAMHAQVQGQTSFRSFWVQVRVCVWWCSGISARVFRPHAGCIPRSSLMLWLYSCII